LILNERALGEAPIDARLEKLFERGIDPASVGDASRHARDDWPTKEQIQAFGQRFDERIYAAIANAQLVNPGVPRLVRGQAIYTVLEHEPMHHETLVYLLHQLAPQKKRPVAQTHCDPKAPHNDFVEIAQGTATLGARRDQIPFGWDNEFDEHRVAVGEFAIQRFPV